MTHIPVAAVPTGRKEQEFCCGEGLLYCGMAGTAASVSVCQPLCEPLLGLKRTEPRNPPPPLRVQFFRRSRMANLYPNLPIAVLNKTALHIYGRSLAHMFSPPRTWSLPFTSEQRLQARNPFVPVGISAQGNSSPSSSSYSLSLITLRKKNHGTAAPPEAQRDSPCTTER